MPVEHVGAIGRGDDDQVGVAVEAIHLDEQLVQRLLALVVTTTHAGTTLASDASISSMKMMAGAFLRLIE